MKVAIAGGSGFIGTALCRALMAAGHEVVILTRKVSGAPTSAPGVRAVRWDPPNRGDWTAEVAGAAAVINLAGASIGRWPWTPRRKRELRESRLAATRALVDAIATLPDGSRPTVLLNASGTDVYEGQDEAPAGEDTRPGGSFLARLCLDWEAEATRAEGLGVRVVLARTSSVIARGAPYLRVISLPYRLLVGGRIGSGRQWVSWVDLADAVGLYLFALESATIDGPLNVSAPDPRQQLAYARALAAALRRPCRFWTPSWIVRLLLRDQATLALGSRRVWPAKALSAGYSFKRPVLEDALGEAL
jgi:uncharacterized protein (TIGR01777 family)